jgi:hypothetical protein
MMATDVTDMETGMAAMDAGGERIGTVADIWEPVGGIGTVPDDPTVDPPTEGYIHIERGPGKTEIYVPFHEILQVEPGAVRLAFGADHADEYIGKPSFLG